MGAIRRAKRIAFAFALAVGVAPVAGCAEADPPGKAMPAKAAEIPEIASPEEVLGAADIPTLDPKMMNKAEIEKVIGTGPRCEFTYASYSEPVLALSTSPGGEAGAVVKLNDKLVALKPAPSDGETVLSADPIRVVLGTEKNHAGSRPGEQIEADMVFEVGNSLRAEFRGYYRCIG